MLVKAGSTKDNRRTTKPTNLYDYGLVQSIGNFNLVQTLNFGTDIGGPLSGFVTNLNQPNCAHPLPTN